VAKDNTLILIGLGILVILLASKTDLFAFLTLDQVLPLNDDIPSELGSVALRTGGGCNPQFSDVGYKWYVERYSASFPGGNTEVNPNRLGLDYTYIAPSGEIIISKDGLEVFRTSEHNPTFENDEIKIIFGDRGVEGVFYKRDTISNFVCVISNYDVNTAGTFSCSFTSTKNRNDLDILAFSATELGGGRLIDFTDYSRNIGSISSGSNNFDITLSQELVAINKQFFIVLVSGDIAQQDIFNLQPRSLQIPPNCPVDLYPQLTLMQRVSYSVGQIVQQQQAQNQSQQTIPQNITVPPAQNQTQTPSNITVPQQQITQSPQQISGQSQQPSTVINGTLPQLTGTQNPIFSNPLFIIGIIAGIGVIIWFIKKNS